MTRKGLLAGIFLSFLIIIAFLISVNRDQTFSLKTTANNLLLDETSHTQAIDTKKAIVKGKGIWSERKKKIKGFAKSDAPDMYARIHREIRTRDGEQNPGYKLNYKIDELNKAVSGLSLKSLNKSSAALDWVERGPGNVSGRTRGLIVDPDDATHMTWFAGSVGGGIWKTTDMGQTWVDKTPDLPNLATTVLAMAESNHDIIYAGTGEGFFNSDAVNGNGIFKSEDRGETWTQLTSTANNLNFQNINRIVVSPTDPDIVLSCANTGFVVSSGSRTSTIQKSTDGGATWTEVYDAGGSRIQHIVANPQNFNTLYATVNGVGVAKSTDAGDTWQLSSNGIGAASRIELAIAPTDTARIYIAVENGEESDLYVSEDAGANWTISLDQSGTNPKWLGGQGWYDNTIAAHPYNEDIVFVGGIDVWKIELQPGTDTTSAITGVEQNNTQSFFGFINWGGPYAGGGLGTGDDFLGSAGVEPEDYVTVEIRFGPGKTQKAHRFLYDGNTGNFLYQDYVDVPFEVWDITNNRQLMASFRDWANNGVFDLIAYNANNLQREYIFVNATLYDAVNPDATIPQTNGFMWKNIYAMWPILATGGTWDPNNLPESNLRINYETIITKVRLTTPVTDGYNQYGKPYIHVDQHNLVMIPTIPETEEFWILNGNDGGVAYSTDGGTTWAEALNGGYNTTQFYGVDKKPGANEYIGGTQDNGTWRSPGAQDANLNSVYLKQLGGDGFETSWHYTDPLKIAVSSQFNNIWRSLDGGLSYLPASDGLGADGAFITKIAKLQSDPDLLFTVGTAGVYRTDNFAENWTLTPISTDWGFSSSFTEVKISIANPQIVWAGANMGSSGKIQVSVDGGLNFSSTVNYGAVTLGRISGLDTHPVEDSTAYVMFSIANAPKILRTTDLGQTWQDISGFGINSSSGNGFPDVATYSLLVMPYNTDILWAGTEIGIFQSLDNGVSWAYLNEGLPAAAVWDMRIVDDQVVVATHGRGIWSVTIPELSDYTQPAVTLSPRLNKAAQSPTGVIAVDASLRSVYDSTHVLINGENNLTVQAGTSLDTLVAINYSVENPEEVTVSLESFKNGVSYKSSAVVTTVYPLASPVQSYSSNFDLGNTDFTGSGFEVSTPAGFVNSAIHSAHPYATQTTVTYQLSVPIEVAASDAFFNYKDIAIVEPGEPGTVYGDDMFWDFVIAEATEDGINWIPLLDGYDARFDTDWLDIYDTSGNPTPELLRLHSANLLDFFDAGSTILIRFRLFSDANTTGWGWIIDDLEIQESITAISSDEPLVPVVFNLSQNYPNPFNPATRINFSLPVNGKVTLQIYNALGQKVATLVDGSMKAGTHTVEWNAANMASGLYFYKIQADNFSSVKKMILLK